MWGNIGLQHTGMAWVILLDLPHVAGVLRCCCCWCAVLRCAVLCCAGNT